jgi:hypothetical protein
MKPPPGFFADAKFNKPILSVRPCEARALRNKWAPSIVDISRIEISAGAGAEVTCWRGDADQVDKSESAA